ncbi:MAG: hypothetical protein ACP5SH_26920 [Syntrophobacteraceae bacterium]
MDFFIPPLAPYIQWVKAYKPLLCTLYDEHKTAARTWKAFRIAVPGIERRLDFEVFEQILLFSLFLAEWDQHDAMGLKSRNERLEKQAADSRKAMQALQNDLHAKEEQLGAVIQELDAARTRLATLEKENDSLKQQSAAAVRQPSNPSGAAKKVTQKSLGPVPLRVGKWNVQLSADGYYRLFRKLGGRLHSIYIGKELDISKAETKIAERERELLGPAPASCRSDAGSQGSSPT